LLTNVYFLICLAYYHHPITITLGPTPGPHNSACSRLRLNTGAVTGVARRVMRDQNTGQQAATSSVVAINSKRPRKRSPELWDKLDARKFDPVEFLVMVAQADVVGLGLLTEDDLAAQPGIQHYIITVDKRVSAAKALMPYAYPQRKTVDETGDTTDKYALTDARAKLAGILDQYASSSSPQEVPGRVN